MPVFRTQPSENLTASIRRAMASSTLGPMAEIQADQMAAETAQKLSLADKARAEAEAVRAAAAQREDPNVATEFAAHSAGVDMPAANRLVGAIRGQLEQPGPSDIDDAAAVGREAEPFPMAKPNLQPGQERRFRSALAATIASRLATGHTNADQLTQAAGNVQGQGITEDVQDAISRGDMDRASAMNQGGKLGTQIKVFDNVGNTGATFAPGSGTVNADPKKQPGNALLASTLDQGAANAQRDRAAADSSRAQAEKVRRENPEGELGKPPAGYRWGPADEKGAPTLLPIAGGPAEKLGESQVKQLVGVQNTRNAITEYRAAIKDFGALDLMNPNARAKMGTIYNNMMLQAKEAYNLGVLNGPDFDILQKVVTDPTTLKGGLISSKALDAQAAKLDEIMSRIGVTVDNASKQRGGNAGAPAAAAPEATKVLGGVTYVKVGGKWFQQ